MNQISEGSEWYRGKAPIIEEFAVQRQGLLDNIASRNFIAVPGQLINGLTVLELHTKQALSGLNYDITARAIERELANQYQKHQVNFDQYKGRLDDYYRESGDSYLARACFIRNNENHKRFDDFVLQTVKAEHPGVGMDFGCGAAPIGFDLARRGQIMHFYDIDGSAPFEFLKWRADKYSLTGTKVFFNTPRPKVDYVLALDSIEHLEDWQEKLSWMADCLNHAGCLITNFMLLGDTTNTEHIFMNHPEFMKYVTSIGLWPINSAIFQKREDLIK